MTAKVLIPATSGERRRRTGRRTIENGTPVFASELSRQSKSSSTKTSGPARTCPDCGAELHASVKINLYAVEVNSDGRIIDYDGARNQQVRKTFSNSANPRTLLFTAQTIILTVRRANCTARQQPASPPWRCCWHYSAFRILLTGPLG